MNTFLPQKLKQCTSISQRRLLSLQSILHCLPLLTVWHVACRPSLTYYIYTQNTYMCTDKRLFYNITKILLDTSCPGIYFFPHKLGRSQLLPGFSYKGWVLAGLTTPLCMSIQVVSGFSLLQREILGISLMILLSWPGWDLLSVPRYMGPTQSKVNVWSMMAPE